MANVGIVSQAFHHLEKSILLKEKVLKDSVIFNFYQDKEKLSSLKRSFNQEYISKFGEMNILGQKLRKLSNI